MVKINDKLNFKSLGKNKNKKQILLTHTSRNISDYIISLKNRMNGNYIKIPNYIISKEGKVFQLLEETEFTNYLGTDNLDKKIVVVSLENLGWLEKTPLELHYNNWIRSIYKGKVYERKWRDYFYWDPYTEEQFESTVELCKYLLNEFSINKKCIGHNTKIDGIQHFEGISTRSNYDSKRTDLSPAFDFEKFVKYIENE